MKQGQKKSGVNGRELALEALLAVAKGEAYSHMAVSAILDKYNYLEAQEKAFIKRLVEGTLERRIQIDYCIECFSSLPVGKMKPLIRELLRMSVYQLLFMDSVPDGAVCNEAVKVAEKRSFYALKGFVNGILRNISRNKEKIAYPDRSKNRIRSLSVEYSMPEWLIEKWDAEQGQERTEAILQGLLKRKPVTVRLRLGIKEQEKAALRKELEVRGVRVKEDGSLPYAWHLEKLEGLRDIPAFAAGQFTVQDVSSMLAVEAAGIRPGDYVMDVCGAPGGKMLFAAEKTGPDGIVLARDISAARLVRMQENKNRMHAKNCILEQWDASVPDQEKYGMADVVLADVPCSGLGVIGRKRDIKYRVTPASIERLLPLQRQILGTVWQYVKPGGVLLYSTCTVSQAENEEMAAWFLSHFPFHRDPAGDLLPVCFREQESVQGFFQFLPGLWGMDGFFIARFVRD